MYLYILGKHSNDIGDQLEQLTSSILRKLDYSNIVRNEIGIGGHEIDVRAVYKIPTPKGVILKKIICECKAHQKPSNMNDWLKFLGKIYIEGKETEIIGCFIALSGVNGNVSGSYEELCKTKDNIILISGETLIENLSKIFELESIKNIQEKILHSTSRKPIEISLSYYNKNLYYLIGFTENCFSLLNEKGEFLSEKKNQILIEMIIKNTSYKTNIDIEAEEKALERQVSLNKIIISKLLIDKKPYNVAFLYKFLQEYPTIFPNINDTEIENALKQLYEKELLDTDIKGGYFLKNDNFDVLYIINLLRYLLAGFIPLFVLNSDEYDKLIEDNLFEAIKNIQAQVIVPLDKKEVCLKILKLSPTALLWALTPNNFFSDKSLVGRKLNNEIEKQYTTVFIHKLYNFLYDDLNSEELREYFYKNRNIVEFETKTNYQLKSLQKIELSMDYNERVRFAKLENYDNIVPILLPQEQPEPWELINPK